MGHMAFGDTLREDAAEVVARLRALGIRVMLLSGDRQSAAAGMAHQVGLKMFQLASGWWCWGGAGNASLPPGRPVRPWFPVRLLLFY